MAAKKKAEVEQERETRRQEQLQKRLEATRKREAQARQGTKSVTTTKSPPSISSQFSIFGGNRRQQQVPEVKKWKQNKDGSISGLIFNSKSLQDGTRVTTSPVPKGAKKGTVVKTAAGTNYSLM
jgi:hypothetical protein